MVKAGLWNKQNICRLIVKYIIDDVDEFELDAVDNGEAVILKLVTKVPELELVRFLNVLLLVEATQLLKRLCDVLHQ